MHALNPGSHAICRSPKQTPTVLLLAGLQGAEAANLVRFVSPFVQVHWPLAVGNSLQRNAALQLQMQIFSDCRDCPGAIDHCMPLAGAILLYPVIDCRHGY